MRRRDKELQPPSFRETLLYIKYTTEGSSELRPKPHHSFTTVRYQLVTSSRNVSYTSFTSRCRIRSWWVHALESIPYAIVNWSIIKYSGWYERSMQSYVWMYSRHLGIGLFFSAFMILLTAIQARYTGFSPKNSEEFSSASRRLVNFLRNWHRTNINLYDAAWNRVSLLLA